MPVLIDKTICKLCLSSDLRIMCLVLLNKCAEAAILIDEIVRLLANMGLTLNASKTKVLTKEAQALRTLATPNRFVLDVIYNLEPHSQH